MSQNRFELLLQYNHFNDNTETKPPKDPLYDPLLKISPLLDRLCTAMKPEEMLTIDKQMILLKDRSLIKQHEKQPHKWGFKMFA